MFKRHVLRLRLLGPAHVEAGDPLERVDVAAQKGAALAFYLAARADQPVPRSRLIALLWADSDEPEGRNSLSTALSRLRRSLPAVPIVPMGDSLVWRSDSTERVWTDIGAFAELTHANATRAQLDQAVDLWRGPFLEGFDLRDCSDWDEWLELERSAWQQRMLDALEHAADAHAAEGDWSGGLAHARRALRMDPLQERFHRQVMQLHERAGDRAAALTHYRTAAEVLASELAVQPDPATQRLYREILSASEHEVPVASPRHTRTDRRPERQKPMFPLVGRQTPLAQLREAADDAAAGRGKVIAVNGEEGIGKSRLVEELIWLLDGRMARDLADGSPWTVLVGACHASEHGLPYHPFVDLLSAAVSGFGSEVGLADVWLAEVARLVPDLVEQRPDLPTPARLDPQQEARRLFEGAARFFGALPTPLLLVVEDLHWADEGSLRMLDYLAHHEALRSTLLITTIRTEDVDEHLLGVVRGLERQRLLERIELGPLAVEATVQLLREVVRDDVRVLGEKLHAETEGNPLFAVETIRSLLESGDLQLGASALTSPQPLPDSVQAAIRARLARLDPDAYELARAAAVLGGDVDFDLVRAVAGQDEDRALAALERLLTTHLLRERTGEAGEAWYSFSHDKVRQVVYDDLSGARRRVQHRRALDVLGQPDARMPQERLAYHALRAQDWDQALRWCEAAAEAAVGVFAYGSAATLYEQALDALSRLPITPEARAHGIRLRLRLARFAFYVMPGRLGEWLAPAERDARELGNPTLLAYVNLAQSGALYIQGRFAEALPLLERIRPIAEARPDPILRAQFPRVYGQLQALRGDYAEAVPALHQAMERLRANPGIELTVATGMLGATYAYMGEFERAFELVLSAQACGESVQDQAALAASEGFLSAVYHMQADWPHAREHGRRAVEIAHAAGSIVHEFVGLVYLGLPEAKLGDPDAGASALLRAIAIAQTTGTWVLLGRTHGWMAEIELDRGQPTSALELARRGKQMSIEHAYLFDAALCERIIGQSLAALGDASAARSHLESAAQHFEAIGAVPELQRTRSALAALD
ncbi:MAG TPA: BTAD domain-containing putative transcriptional regulator [Chloroflexota bacterium]